MTQPKNIEIKVGIFVLVCSVVIAALIIRFGKYTKFRENSYDVTVAFPNVGGIVNNATVLYAGIPVGKVKDIELDPNALLQVNVKLAIYEKYRDSIRNDVKFVINQSGLLGDRYIDVIPQSATAPPLEPGDIAKGSTSVDLSEAIRSVVEVLHQAAGTIERIDNAIKRIDEMMLSTQNFSHVSTTLANIETASSNIVLLATQGRSVVEDNREQIESSLAMFTGASTNLKGASEHAEQLLKRVDDLVLNNQENVLFLTKNLAESSERLNSLLIQLEKGEGTAGKLLTDSTLHDEIVHLVQNWRRFGLLYKERKSKPKRPEPQPKRGRVPVPARPAKKPDTENSNSNRIR